MSDDGSYYGEPKDTVGPLVGGIAIGMALVAITWFIASGIVGGSANGAHTAGPGTTVAGQTSDSSTVGTSPGRRQRCAAAATALERPLHRAVGSIAQWEIHVGAMNKLVVGAITLSQANAFWSRTRIGAYRRIDRFDTASAQVDRDGIDCPPPALLPAWARPGVRRCARQVAADLRALQAARTAIATWHRHVRDMDMLESGAMSSYTATQMWLSMWQRGVQEIRTYRTAVQAADQVHGCKAAESGLTASPSPS